MLCPGCETDKPIEDFPKTYNKRYPEARRNICKTCFRKLPSQKRHHSEKHNRRRSKKYLNLKSRAVEYLGGRCQGESCPLPESYAIPYYVFDFHHRDPAEKEFNISRFICRKHVKLNIWDNLVKELNKCDLLCCICHRKVHFDK